MAVDEEHVVLLEKHLRSGEQDEAEKGPEKEPPQDSDAFLPPYKMELKLLSVMV